MFKYLILIIYAEDSNNIDNMYNDANQEIIYENAETKLDGIGRLDTLDSVTDIKPTQSITINIKLEFIKLSIMDNN